MEQDDKVIFEFYSIFDNIGTSISKIEVQILGRSQGLNDNEINPMIEHLLDNGFIHEPIQDYFASTRDGISWK